MKIEAITTVEQRRISRATCALLAIGIAFSAQCLADGKVQTSPIPAAPADSAVPFASASPDGPGELPELLRPVTLRDGDGNAESDLVDPFRRRSYGDGEPAMPGEDGLMRTTMGEISSDFRILAITIPQDTNTPRLALIQLHASDEPILVHEGDLVRVDRTGGAGHGAKSPARARGGRASASASAVRGAAGRAVARSGQTPRQTSYSDVEEQLKKFVFYVNVKRIEPTYIEVYHNKKRPDETIRLNW